EPVRSFETGGPLEAALQTLFPDLTIRNGLAISYTLWTTMTGDALGVAATMGACDSFGRCASASAGQEARKGQLSNVSATAAAGAPQAVIVAPTAGSFVAASDGVSVIVAAEAGAALKEVIISLDGAAVQT